MKASIALQNRPIWLFAVVMASITIQVGALTADNPYGAIAGRNVFALRPPPPPTPTAPPPAVPPGVELQGISTILGRPQVLLKIKMPPRPPEPARDKSVVLDVGQREGDVEVLAIDNIGGVIKLKNQGNEISLSMKDNAAKPAAGPALPAPVLGQPPSIAPSAGGGIPSPTGAPAAGTLPTRQIRSDAGGGAAMGAMGAAGSTGGVQPQTSSRSLEENVALYEANRAKNEKLIESGAKIPRLPMHPLLRKSEATQ